MKRILFVLSMLIGVAYGQVTGHFRFDSTMLYKNGGNNELILLNGTRGVTGGVLTNIGNGRTSFVTPTGGFNTSIGSGYKVAVDGTNNIKSFLMSNGISGDSATAGQVGIKLGQAVGAAGSPSAFTSDREIDVDSNRLYFQNANVTITNNKGIGLDDSQFPLIVQNTSAGGVKTAKFIADINEVEIHTNAVSPNAFATLNFYHNNSLKSSFGYDGGTTPHLALDVRNGMDFNYERGTLGGVYQIKWDGTMRLAMDSMGVIIGERSIAAGLSNGAKFALYGRKWQLKDSIALRTSLGSLMVNMYDTITGYHERMSAADLVTAGGGGGSGSGTVTSVDLGYGITGSSDPITTTGTVILDTTIAMNKEGQQVVPGLKILTTMPYFTTLTSGRVPFVTTNGALTDDASLIFNSTTNLLTLSGPSGSTTAGPKISFNYDGDANSAMSYFAYTHNNIAGPVWDAWYNGSNWVSSYSGSNFSLYKSIDELAIGYNAGTTAGVTFGGFNTTGGLRMGNNGKVGIGTAPAALAKFNVLSTTEQQRILYDASNYYSTTVGSTGDVTFNAVGSGSAFSFSDNVGIGTATATQALTVNGQVRINAINNASVFDSVVVINGGVLEARLASTLVGATPGLQDVITQDAALIGSNEITIANSTDLTFTGGSGSGFVVNINGKERLSLANAASTISGGNGSGSGNQSGVIVGDSVSINPYLGILNIDSLRSGYLDTTLYKPLARKASGDIVQMNSWAQVSGPVTLKGYTVATLPAGVIGMMAYVTDALTPTYGAVAVGGGAVVTPVFYDGTNWTTR